MIESKAPRFVTAAEITRNFGMWQDRAAQAPLVVTHHGRPRVVMIAAEDYELLSRPPAEHGATSTDGTALGLLVERIDGGFAAFDAQLRFVRLNGAALVHFDLPVDALVGRSLVELFPALDGGPVPALLRRVARSSEAASLETPSLLRPGRLLRLHAFPWPGGLALLFRDVAEEELAARALAERAALTVARDVHGGAVTARLSLRGTFERVDPALARLAGFAPERLLGVRLTDLLALSRRGAALSEIEAVLGRGEARCLDTMLLVNGGGERAARIGMAPLRDGFAIGGAMLVMTMT